jgi:bifunctional non-homologous end joining protein LigD
MVKAFTRKVAESFAEGAPELYIATMSKAKRKGKIFIDYLRNARTATAVSAYSTRARASAPVSVPLSWDELAADVREDHFTIRNVPQRLSRLRRDPWESYEKLRAPLRESMLKKL